MGLTYAMINRREKRAAEKRILDSAFERAMGTLRGGGEAPPELLKLLRTGDRFEYETAKRVRARRNSE